MTTATLTDELLDLLLEGSPGCTSRAEHRCTEVATHAARSTVPCPDPIRLVYWCMGRYKAYLFHLRFEVNCVWCKRPTETCWTVWPI